MDSTEAQTQQEIARIVPIVEELTGPPSWWSGRVKSVPDAELRLSDMDLANEPARKRLIRQMFSANTLAEANAAIEALKQWRREHPEDMAILDGGEILSHLKDYEEWKLANPEQWQAQQEAERRAVAALEPERGRMLQGARNARTVVQLDRAERELYQWAVDHPEDVGRELGISEALEQVLTRREALATPPEPVLAGRAA